MFCNKCGAKTTNEDVFCSKCGTKINNIQSTTEDVWSNSYDNSHNKQSATKEIWSNSYDNSYNKVVLFIKNAPLLISGLIMSLLTLPIHLWFELKIRLPGEIRGRLADYGDYHEMRVWDKAISSSDTLGVFCCIGIFVLILGMVVYINEYARGFRKSKLKTICFFIIPTVVIAIVAICTYPALFNYASTFSYLIY